MKKHRVADFRGEFINLKKPDSVYVPWSVGSPLFGMHDRKLAHIKRAVVEGRWWKYWG